VNATRPSEAERLALREEADKAKRDQRVERLVSELSQEELKMLRRRLVNNEGEIVSMDNLLDDDAGARRSGQR
jgi:hypothetical protein